jgi:hypothetical protein
MVDDFKQGLLQNWRIAINAYPISDECACWTIHTRHHSFPTSK